MIGATHAAGIDVGSATTKAVILDRELRVVGRHVVRSGASFERAAERALTGALAEARLDRASVGRVVGTGYGRSNVPALSATRTEIACHGRGAYHHFGRAITVVDIGGQDNKVIELDAAGRRVSFKMNRKCAAGTGAFVEEIARRLDVPLEALNGLAAASTTKQTLNSFCTVFAATEILARIREGATVEDLARAALRSVVRRIVESHTLAGDVVLTGGVVAHNPVVVDLLEEATGTRPLLPPEPQLVGALGAALFAWDVHVDAAPSANAAER
jgi:predicted CoA-substrate-specific enzyme activase